MEFKECVKEETIQRVKKFLKDHPTVTLSYWEWRECNELALEIYKELEDSTKGFGEEIDMILKKYNVEKKRDLDSFETCQINKELSKIKVVENKEIHRCLEELQAKRYF